LKNNPAIMVERWTIFENTIGVGAVS